MQRFTSETGERFHCEEPAETAPRIQATLAEEDDAHLDAIVYNAGVRIHLGGGCDSIEAGIALARETIACGAAARKLAELKA